MARYPIRQQFWRSEALPWLEVRNVQDGRTVSYAPHTHETFSIGAIVGGASSYLNEKTRIEVSEGTVVLMNPGDLHACNPLQNQPWAYRMFYFDSQWLNELTGREAHDVCHFTQTWTDHPALFNGLNRLYHIVVDEQRDALEKACEAAKLMLTVQQLLRPQARPSDAAPALLARVKEKINDEYQAPLTLAELAHTVGLSVGHLIRLCQQHYGATPHALLMNRRLHIAREQLKRGAPLAEVALDVGFADQAHFQRAFKQHLAVTPKQYRDLL
ncbi:helix-turn-helix transcriptional regulator [Atlantibacter hermannii]|uniref:helix-turn-helix transcriptional regulator n=1 Tax=Atlantibacter hermannii TaxID=565 RepID=UPI0028A82572|nr:AraC family transcriptional regulator [Atlantibacter hermannii]